jgi:hypothetical protein
VFSKISILETMRLTLFLLLLSLSAVGQNSAALKFIQNKGQWNSDVDFAASIPGGRLGVSANGFSVLLIDMNEIERRHLATHESVNESDGHPDAGSINGHYFRINFIGSNNCSKPVAESQLDEHYNYYIGRDTARWATNAHSFGTIVYPDFYSGIDFRVTSIGRNLKYDFLVKPGADPSQIKIEYAGLNSIQKFDNELQLNTILGSLSEEKPYSYQTTDQNAKQTVQSEYQLDENVVSFSFPEDYDHSQALVIDPLLIFSTYSGSPADNWGSTATPGEHGALYSAGVTLEDPIRQFPATVGAFQTLNGGGVYDMAIIKYDSAGTKFLYATYLGGSGNDSPQSLVVDKASGDLIVLGISGSDDYPTTPNSFDNSFNFGTSIYSYVLDTENQWDIVVTRFSAEGDLLKGSTFLGGSDNDGQNFPKDLGGSLVANYGDEMRGDVITDDAGNVYISSVTSSNDFPIINGFDHSFNGGITDGLVVKLTPDLSSIVWSSYIGGSGFDAAYSIKFDNNKNIILAGGTTSVNFPAKVGAYQTGFNGDVDGWIVRVAADGSAIMNATLTGTSAFDQVYFVDLNSNGDIFCYGQTTGHMPVTADVYHNTNAGQFLQKFSPDLSTLQFSTVFGAPSSSGSVIPNISPTAFLVNDCNNIYMAGWGGLINSSPELGFWQSSTKGMAVTSDAYQKTTSGSDFYFIVLNANASTLVYSTFLGGNFSRTHVDGGTSRFDKYGIVYHAVCSGCAAFNEINKPTSDFPTTPNAKSRINGSKNCNNAAFKFDLSSLKAMFNTNNLALTMPGYNDVCYPDSIVFENLSTGGRTITWDFGDGTVITQNDTDPRSLVHRYQQPGQYNVKLTITDLSTCSQTDITSKIINYYKDNIVVGTDTELCEGAAMQLTASGGTQYQWTSENGMFSSVQQSPEVQPSESTKYFVTIVDANGCMKKDTIMVDVVPRVDLKWEHRLTGHCIEAPALIVENFIPAEDGMTFHFDFGDGTTSSDNRVVHVYEKDSLYSLTFKVEKKKCSYQETVRLPVYKVLVPNVFTPDDTPGYNDKFEVVLERNMAAPSDAGIIVQLIVVDKWGKSVFVSKDYKNDWTAKDVPGGVYYVYLQLGDFGVCKDWLQIVK